MKIKSIRVKLLSNKNGSKNTIKRDNLNVSTVQGRLGLSVVAIRDIPSGTHIASFNGNVYAASKASALPSAIVNHAIQFSNHLWRDSRGLAKYLNHSCSPNCFISGVFDIYTLRDIEKGEELTWDYSTSEDSDWVVPGGKCLCLTANCRGGIPPYRSLSNIEKNRVERIISDWIYRRG